MREKLLKCWQQVIGIKNTCSLTAVLMLVRQCWRMRQKVLICFLGVTISPEREEMFH